MTYELSSEIGHFISQEHKHIAQLIKEYDERCDLVFIPLTQRALDETFPFAIIHTPENKPAYIIRKVREQDMNAELIAWLHMSDGTKNMRDLNAWQDAQDLAKKRLEDAAVAEANAEKADLAESIIKGKNWYRHNGKVYS